jgi:predicted ATPase
MDKSCIDAKRFIFTGAPGSGKTTVIQELEKLEHIVIHESATDIIAQEQADGNIRPWEQPDFVDKIVLMQKVRQMSAKGELQFYDRSPFCTYALGLYLSKCLEGDFIPSPILSEEISRCLKNNVYQNTVFFFENLGFIEHTEARKISYEDALIFEQIHLDVYKKFGFNIVLVHKESIKERCKFILERTLC